MQIQFDGRRGKSRQILRTPENLGVRYYGDFAVCRVQPGWNLTVCYDINVMNPRSIHFDRTQAVPVYYMKLLLITSIHRYHENDFVP
jgi:hypothetical protein